MGSEKWTLRAARHADIPQMQQIEREAGQVFIPLGMRAVAEDLPPEASLLAARVDDGAAWIAVDGAGVPIGYAIASFFDGEGHVDQVSVIPEATGQGIGTALLERVDTWALALGARSVTLTTFATVRHNGPYYSRRGYEIVADDGLTGELAAIRHREREAGLDDIAPRQAMRKRLPAPGSVREDPPAGE